MGNSLNKMKNEGDRHRVITLYEEYIRNQPDLIAALPELVGKVCGCYCPPDKMCHTDVCAKVYTEIYEKQTT